MYGYDHSPHTDFRSRRLRVFPVKHAIQPDDDGTTTNTTNGDDTVNCPQRTKFDSDKKSVPLKCVALSLHRPYDNIATIALLRRDNGPPPSYHTPPPRRHRGLHVRTRSLPVSGRNNTFVVGAVLASSHHNKRIYLILCLPNVFIFEHGFFLRFFFLPIEYIYTLIPPKITALHRKYTIRHIDGYPR